jgi:hypothetical protein
MGSRSAFARLPFADGTKSEALSGGAAERNLWEVRPAWLISQDQEMLKAHLSNTGSQLALRERPLLGVQKAPPGFVNVQSRFREIIDANHRSRSRSGPLWWATRGHPTQRQWRAIGQPLGLHRAKDSIKRERHVSKDITGSYRMLVRLVRSERMVPVRAALDCPPEALYLMMI